MKTAGNTVTEIVPFNLSWPTFTFGKRGAGSLRSFDHMLHRNWVWVWQVAQP